MRKFICLIICLLNFSITAFAYNDVLEGDWFYEPVMSLSEENIITGYSDGSFQPYKLITQEEFTKILVNTIPLDDVESVAIDDVEYWNSRWSEWSQPNLTKAIEKGIVDTGLDTSMAYKNKAIRRETAAKLLARTVSAKGITLEMADESEIADLYDICVYCRSYVRQVYHAGIMTGYNNYFNGSGSMTRAEAAAVIYRLRNYVN